MQGSLLKPPMVTLAMGAGAPLMAGSAIVYNRSWHELELVGRKMAGECFVVRLSEDSQRQTASTVEPGNTLSAECGTRALIAPEHPGLRVKPRAPDRGLPRRGAPDPLHPALPADGVPGARPG
jgi:hypothetical protein